MLTSIEPTETFHYDDYQLQPERSRLVCRYSTGSRQFEEQITFAAGGDWSSPAVDAAARLVHLLAGVSYFKTSAPRTIDLGPVRTTAAERAFLRSFYIRGLAEFAYLNSIDLTRIEIVAREQTVVETTERPVALPGSPLIPFGGGIDSIVTAEHVRSRFPGTSLFVVGGPDGRFEAIERPASLTGLPVVRAERAIDPQVRNPDCNGFLNGHVPVTGILSAIAVMAAVLGGHDAVVMSNEWSASTGSTTAGDLVVNHQYSKSAHFEQGLRSVLAPALGSTPKYFSLLRSCSELWVARRFAELHSYHRAFRSCNRAFQLDPSERLDRWCGACDKCCFVDLILSPFVEASTLRDIFDGREPLEDPSLGSRFEALLGTSAAAKPFECVGEIGESRAALLLAANRSDRSQSTQIKRMVESVREAGGAPEGIDYLAPMGDHGVPIEYSIEDQLV